MLVLKCLKCSTIRALVLRCDVYWLLEGVVTSLDRGCEVHVHEKLGQHRDGNKNTARHALEFGKRAKRIPLQYLSDTMTHTMLLVKHTHAHTHQ